MIACPNKNAPAWNEMVTALGEYEAYKAFMVKGDLLTTEEIAKLYNPGDIVKVIDSKGQVYQTTYERPAIVDYTEHNKTAGSVITSQLLESLSQRLGVDYNIVTPKDAESITRDARNPWNGEKAFFYKGKVYLIDGAFSADDAIHEFAHPLVRALRLSNPTLFSALAAEAMENSAIAEEIEALYGEDHTEEEKLEEAVVRGIQENVKAQDIAPAGNFLQRVLYGIKQFLRQIFGRGINVSNLSANTTLADMARMLTVENFDLNISDLSQQDYVAYVRDIQNLKNELTNVERTAVGEAVNNMFTLVSSQLSKMNRNRKMQVIRELLSDEANRGYLQGVKNILKNVASLETILDESVDESADVARRAEQFIHSLFRIKAMVERIDQELSSLAGDETQDAFAKVYYFDNIVSSWQKVLATASELLNEGGLASNSLLAKEIDTIVRGVERTQSTISQIYKASSIDLIWESLAPMAENIARSYDQKIAEAEAAGATAAVAKLKKEKAQYVFDKKTLGQMIEGKLGDTNPYSAFLESYINNPDLIVGGFSLFLKNKLTEVHVNTQERVNQIAATLHPLLKAAGYDANNVTSFGRKITFIDKKARLNDQGELEEYEVRKFLDKFKMYEADRTRLRHELDELDKKNDYAGMREKVREIQQWEANYMHREYVNDFYEKEKIYTEAGEVGYEAKGDKDLLLEKINNHRLTVENSAETTEEDRLVEKELWRQYRELSSLTYPDGTKKQGRELEKAELHKRYKKESRKFYEEIEIKGAFEDALNSYEQSLFDRGVEPGSEEFENLRKEWIEDNTRNRISEEYYTRKQVILNEISGILKQYPGATALNQEVSEIYTEILNLSSVYRDEDGQIVGGEVSEGRLEAIREAQEKVVELKKKVSKMSGLTLDQFERLEELYAIKNTRDWTEEENLEFADLIRARDETTRMSRIDKARLVQLYSQLAEMQNKVATDYYVDELNDHLARIARENPELQQPMLKGLTRATANLILNTPQLRVLMNKDAKFAEWFNKNHLLVEKFNYRTAQNEMQYERLFVWNKTVPNRKFIEKTTLSTGEEILGIPSNDYFFRNVKKEYKTAKVVGETIDNRGNWLPKTLEQGAVDDKYINQEYYKVQSENPALFAALEKIKEMHLENQLGGSKSAKLYLEVPRYQKENLEYLQSTDVAEEKIGKIRSIYKAVKAKFVRSEDDAEEGYNFDAADSFDLVQTDMFDDEISTIQVSGKYRLPVDQVSLDVVGGMIRYMQSLERQKKLIEINPHVQALQKVLKDPRNAVKDMKKVNRYAYLRRGITNFANKKGTYIRAAAIDNLIAREFDGEKVVGIGSDNVALQKSMNTLFGLASFRFFAFDIPSALKNRFGAILQNNIEAVGGNNFSLRDYAKGKGSAWRATTEISSQIYHKGPKSLHVQLVEVFDPVQGRYAQKAADVGSRTLLRDLATTSVLFSPRKIMELQASMEFFFSMMHGQKVEQTINGETRTIDYADAWELVDGQLTLKEGIDKSYDKGGAKFKSFVNKTHDLMNKLQGTYSDFDQPEGQRYLMYKFASFLRRYFTSMLVNRFGSKRYNSAGLELSAGYYREFGDFLSAVFRNAQDGTFYFTPEEKRGALKTTSEIAQLMALSLLITLGLGFDKDDDDKYKKMRERSGPMPLLGVADSEYDFDFGGWLYNHAIYQAMLVNAENRQFVPMVDISYKGTEFNFGFSDYANLLDVSSVVIGPTFQAYGKIVNDAVQTVGGDDRAYYKRDMGPFEWQQKGSSKVLNHIGKLFGIKGTTVDPTQGVATFVGVEARNR